jgi:hypothetical protein
VSGFIRRISTARLRRTLSGIRFLEPQRRLGRIGPTQALDWRDECRPERKYPLQQQVWSKLTHRGFQLYAHHVRRQCGPDGAPGWLYLAAAGRRAVRQPSMPTASASNRPWRCRSTATSSQMRGPPCRAERRKQQKRRTAMACASRVLVHFAPDPAPPYRSGGGAGSLGLYSRLI